MPPLLWWTLSGLAALMALAILRIPWRRHGTQGWRRPIAAGCSVGQFSPITLYGLVQHSILPLIGLAALLLEFSLTDASWRWRARLSREAG